MGRGSRSGEAPDHDGLAMSTVPTCREVELEAGVVRYCSGHRKVAESCGSTNTHSSRCRGLQVPSLAVDDDGRFQGERCANARFRLLECAPHCHVRRGLQIAGRRCSNRKEVRGRRGSGVVECEV